MNLFFQKDHPIPQIWLNRFFLGVVICLALIAGYFYTETQRLAKGCWQDQDNNAVMRSLLQEKR